MKKYIDGREMRWRGVERYKVGTRNNPVILKPERGARNLAIENIIFYE